jgi:hypothetical protein
MSTSLPLGQDDGLVLGGVARADELEQLHHLLALGEVLEAAQGRKPAVARGGGDQEALDHRVLEEELRDLEGARDAEARDRARRMCRDVLAEELDAAGLRLEVARGDVEEGGLAGAVRPDDRQMLPGLHVEIDAVGRDHAAETDHQSARAEHDLRHAADLSPALRRRTIPIRPAGARRMIAMSTKPRIICQASASCAEA